MEHGGNLRAGRRTLWIEQIADSPLHPSAADGLSHRCPCVIRDPIRVPEPVQLSLAGQRASPEVRVTAEDDRQLFAGDEIVRSEPVRAVAREDAVLRRPCDRVGVPRSGFHIGKGAPSLRRGTALHAPENGRHHGARRRTVRLEQLLSHTAHQSVFIDEQHVAMEPVPLGNIDKGIGHAGAWLFVRAPARVYGHIPRQIDAGGLVGQSAVAVPADKGVAVPGRSVPCQVNVGVVASLHIGNSTAAACFKAQRIAGDGRIVDDGIRIADIRPMGVDGGIC